jgi:hypothetical protein
MNVTIRTPTALALRSLEPASFSEKLLIYSGDRSCELDSSSGSNLLVSNILPGVLRPLSNLDRPKIGFCHLQFATCVKAIHVANC